MEEVKKDKVYIALNDVLKNPGMYADGIGRALVLFEHRTHQQSVVRNMVNLLNAISIAMVDMEGEDARNQAAKEYCKKFLEFNKENNNGMPYV